MKRSTSYIVILLLVIYIFPAGVFSQIQNLTAKWVNKVSWLSYPNSPQAQFNTYIDTCPQLNCAVRVLEQKDVPYAENYAVFDWIADPVEVQQVPDSVKIVAMRSSTSPDNLPTVRLKVMFLQKTEGGGYFSEAKDINSVWSIYTWIVDDWYRNIPSFEGFGVGVTVGQSSSAMKAVIAISRIELWKNGTCYYMYLFSKTTAIENDVVIPTGFTLSQNYPNPFNPSTRIKISVPESGDYKLAVYNTLGEEIYILVNGSLPVGLHEFSFNAVGLPSGMYIYRLIGRNISISKKMALVK